MFKTITAFTTGLVVGAGAIGFLVARELHGLLEKKDIVEGDMVQWESNGVFMFSTPKKVVKIENSEFGKYVFVEGGKTGLPLEQLIKIS